MQVQVFLRQHLNHGEGANGGSRMVTHCSMLLNKAGQSQSYAPLKVEFHQIAHCMTKAGTCTWCSAAFDKKLSMSAISSGWRARTASQSAHKLSIGPDVTTCKVNTGVSFAQRAFVMCCIKTDSAATWSQLNCMVCMSIMNLST